MSEKKVRRWLYFLQWHKTATFANLKNKSMNTIYIDFADLGDYEDFYNQLKEKVKLPEHFGDNLDALSDVITGELEMPLHLEFVNMSVDQLEIFEDLLTTLEDAEDEMKDFSFAYYLEQYDDDDDETYSEDEITE